MLNNYERKINQSLNFLKTKYSRNRKLVTGLLLLILSLFITTKFGFHNHFSNASLIPFGSNTPISEFKVVSPTVKYGFALDTFQVVQDKILPDQAFSEILASHKVDFNTIHELTQKAKDIFNFSKVIPGHNYMVLSKDSTQGADYLIYEPDAFRYVVFNFKGTPDVKEVKREVKTTEREASGIINESLWNTMVENGLSYEITDKMEDALKWSVDFHHLQDSDQFKLIFEEQSIDGKVVGIGKLKAAYYKNAAKDQEHYAIYFEDGAFKGYFNKEGRPMKAGFLKSPLKFSHVSSHFNMHRLHPILGYVRPHLGTDYAAPYGTPILAVADGTILESRFGSGNGNYVKIKHDRIYQTQYLHMSRFAKGIRPGAHVHQGQVIGYVGATGLATGPHVCFRFWKNGRQVNHLREKLPSPSIMNKKELDKFKFYRDEILASLDKIQYLTPEQLALNKKKLEDNTKVNP